MFNLERGGVEPYSAARMEANHTRQEVKVDLKSNIFWAIASIALMASALYVDQGPGNTLMAEYTESAQESAG